AITVGVVLAQMFHRQLDRFPGVAEEVVVLVAAQHVVAPDHENVFAVEIAPVGNILIVVLIDIHKRVFGWGTKIVRGRPWRFTLNGFVLLIVLQLPRPKVMLRIALRNGVSVLTHLLLLDVRPKLYQRERAVEANVRRAIVRIIETFEISETVSVLGRDVQGIRRSGLFVGPERAAVREYIEFVKELAPIPFWLGFVLDIGFLPGINLVAPALVTLERCTCNIPGVCTGGVEELSVMPDPFAASTELNHREIPRKRHRYELLFFGRKR